MLGHTYRMISAYADGMTACTHTYAYINTNNEYRSSHYFRLQIFHVRNFRVTIFSSISRVRHIFAMYNTTGK